MSIISSSQTARMHLMLRFDELKLSIKNVIEDAEKRGFKIQYAHLGDYLSLKRRGLASLSEIQIVWLLTRWGIYVSVLYGKPVVRNNEARYEVHPYDEKEALAQLNKIKWEQPLRKRKMKKK